MMGNVSVISSEEELKLILGGSDFEKKAWYGYGYQLGWRSKWNLNHPYFPL